MKEETVKDQNDSSSDESLNVALTYEYTESFVAQRSKSVDDLNARLTTFLGFAGVLLRFGLSLPDSYLSCKLLKAGVLGLSAFSIWQSGHALTSMGMGNTVKPNVLMSDNWFFQDNVTVRAKVATTWFETIEGLDAAIEKKKKKLNRTIYCLAVAASLFAICSLIVTFFPYQTL